MALSGPWKKNTQFLVISRFITLLIVLPASFKDLMKRPCKTEGWLSPLPRHTRWLTNSLTAHVSIHTDEFKNTAAEISPWKCSFCSYKHQTLINFGMLLIPHLDVNDERCSITSQGDQTRDIHQEDAKKDKYSTL